ncbi:MAG: alanyl-tRNA editing protein [Candidatus Bathyarchaeota archaeon]|nr:MAG: alanyl-tRNA editing protein [Candidatus Bathyarchaeota archaeon]
MSDEIRAHTALHVLKGAVAKVLGVKWTAGVSVQGSHGRLIVQFDRKPSDDEMARIEEEANAMIGEDARVEVLEMDRTEAEGRWGNLIYDLFPLPASITRLQIFHLPGWNVNACNKQHTGTTSEIGSLKISKVRFRTGKKLLEISYDVQ